MVKFLLWIWQLPQNLAGWIYSRFGNKVLITDGNNVYTVYFTSCFRAGVTLGQYIILDSVWGKTSKNYLIQTVKHEDGHTKQSKYLGIFYLILVGIPSVTRNILNRINSKKFNSKWYYSGYPEKWADELGGVKR